MRLFYTLLFYILIPFIVLRLLYRSIKAPAYRARMSERFGCFKVPKFDKKVIWIHAVSFGETIAATPYIKELQKRHPECQIVVTSTTPTGSAKVQQNFGESVFNVYAPYDYPGAIKRFMKKINPTILIMVETELWPNWLHYCEKKNIPSVLMNARLSERSMKNYQKHSYVTKAMLQKITKIIAQYDADAERFKKLGVSPKRITVAGSVKFDMELAPGVYEKGLALREQLGKDRPVWMAGSTHPGEEEIILKAHKKILEDFPRAILMLVPRHADRFKQVVEQVEKKFKCITRSSGESALESTQVFVGDTMGEMMIFYGACDVAFVGGSLNNTGGHNVLEPALWKKPVLSGAALFNFQVISDMMEQAGGLDVVHDADECAAVVMNYFSNPVNAKKHGELAYSVVEKNRGALERQVDITDEFLC